MKWPATGDELREAGYRSTARARCKSCGAPIIWARTPRGGDAPLEQVPDEDPEARFQSHFTTCAHAEFHRRRARALGTAR